MQAEKRKNCQFQTRTTGTPLTQLLILTLLLVICICLLPDGAHSRVETVGGVYYHRYRYLCRYPYSYGYYHSPYPCLYQHRPYYNTYQQPAYNSYPQQRSAHQAYTNCLSGGVIGVPVADMESYCRRNYLGQ